MSDRGTTKIARRTLDITTQDDRLKYRPMAICSGGLLAFAFLTDSVLAHRRDLTITQFIEHGGIPLRSTVLYAVATIVGLSYRLPQAWRSLKRPELSGPLLLATSATVAAVTWHWFIAAAIGFLTSLLSSFLGGRSRSINHY